MTTINLRISNDLRNRLDDIAEQNNLTTSEYARSIFEDHFKNLSNYQETEEEIEEEEEENEKIEGYFQQKYFELLDKEFEAPDLINSLEFLQLICWIYDHKSPPFEIHTVDQYAKFQKTIIKISNDPIFSEDLKKEFNKVLVDLLKIEGNNYLRHYQLEFSRPLNFQRFNFGKLKKFIFERNENIKTVKI